MKKFSEFFLTGRPLDLKLAEIGYKLQTSKPFINPVDVSVPESLPLMLDIFGRTYRLGNEQAKREAIVGPVLATAADTHGNTQIETETPLASKDISGTVDYWITSKCTLLVVEAKDQDINRGLGQLSAQLIATVEQPDVSAPPYGIVTDGDRWRFATIDEPNKTIIAEQNIYAIPIQLKEVFQRVYALLDGRNGKPWKGTNHVKAIENPH
ncbi:MAG: hypothetical protein AAF702_38890 [Chloroflexota bacterium]